MLTSEILRKAAMVAKILGSAARKKECILFALGGDIEKYGSANRIFDEANRGCYYLLEDDFEKAAKLSERKYE